MRSAVVALLLLPLVASAQDMPLFTFTKSGEGWVNPNRVEGVDYVDALIVGQGKKVEADFKFRNGGGKYSLAYQDGTSLLDRPRKYPCGKITAVARTPDKGTVYVAFNDDDSVWAFTPDKDNKLVNGAPYAPLRTYKGYDNSTDARDKLKPIRRLSPSTNSPSTPPVGSTLPRQRTCRCSTRPAG